MRYADFADRFPVVDARGDRRIALGYAEGQARDDVLAHGAVLVRDSGLRTPDELEAASRLVLHDLRTAYTGGVVPRTNFSRHVFSSTEVTGAVTIKMHNELAYQEDFPRFLTFLCDTPSRIAGETPVAHEADVRRELDPRLLAAIEDDEVVYTRRYLSARAHPRKVRYLDTMFVPWETSFGTEDRDEVEAFCAGVGGACTWLSDDSLEVRTQYPVLRPLPGTDRTVFFNQILAQHFSVASLGRLTYWAYRAAGVDARSAVRHARLARYGDLSSAEVTELDRANERASHAFGWRRGDWMLIDNMQVIHGRNRFLGKRSIRVTMGY